MAWAIGHTIYRSRRTDKPKDRRDRQTYKTAAWNGHYREFVKLFIDIPKEFQNQLWLRPIHQSERNINQVSGGKYDKEWWYGGRETIVAVRGIRGRNVINDHWSWMCGSCWRQHVTNHQTVRILSPTRLLPTVRIFSLCLMHCMHSRIQKVKDKVMANDHRS